MLGGTAGAWVSHWQVLRSQRRTFQDPSGLPEASGRLGVQCCGLTSAETGKRRPFGGLSTLLNLVAGCWGSAEFAGFPTENF